MDEYQYQQKHSEEGEMYEYLQQWMDEYQYQYQQKHSEEGGMYEYLQQKKKQQQQEQQQQQQQQKQKQVNEYPDDHHVLKDVPELIIFNILIRIPAELLFNKFRSVCKNWLGIISSPLFVEQLPNYSKPSLLLQFPPKPHCRSKIRPTLIRIKEEKGGGDETEVEILNKKRNNHLCAMGGIRGSCNGLLLTHDTSSYPKLKMIVFNPTTRCMHTLPKCLSGCPHKTCSFALAFDSDTFKVVHMYADQFGFEIYNLGTATAAAAATNTGSDDVQHSRKGSKKKKKSRNDDGTYSWRKVPGPFEYVYERPFNVEKFCWSDATMVNSRFLHWKVDSKDYITSMDVSDERSRKTPLPHNHEACSNLERLDYTLVEMGGYLALMFGVQQKHDLDDDDDEHSIIIDQLDFWILKDFEEGIWMKRLSISMECINFVKCQPQLDMLRPRGCLEDGEVIVFERVSSGSSSASSGFYVYDVKSSSMKKVAMKMKLGEYKVVAYRSCFTSWTKESIKEGRGNK